MLTQRIDMPARGLLHLSVCAALVIFTTAAYSQANIINPSFETGDLTGWTPSGLDAGMAVANGGATDGTRYVTAVVNWEVAPNGPLTDSWPPNYYWGSGITQQFVVPPGATTFSIDVREVGITTPYANDWILLQSPTIESPVPEAQINVLDQAETITPLANGWSRYTVDVTGLDRYEYVTLSVAAWGQCVGGLPDWPIEFSVDNIQITPEPMTFALLGTGCLLKLIRRR